MLRPNTSCWCLFGFAMTLLESHERDIQYERCVRSPVWDIKSEIIISNHEFEVGIEKSVLRITDWHHEACPVMTNGVCEGQIFLYHSQTNKGLFFLLTTKNLILYWKNMKTASTKSWIRWDATWWHHFNISMMSWINMWPFLSFPWAGMGMRD